jgi:hypothetical protein
MVEHISVQCNLLSGFEGFVNRGLWTCLGYLCPDEVGMCVMESVQLSIKFLRSPSICSSNGICLGNFS